MPDILRIGVIGLGRAGSSMLAAMAQHPDTEVAAAADLHQEHLDRFTKEFGGETYHDIADLLSQAKVDAVYIATPHEFHVAHVIQAARAGKHVIVEKPLALTLEDCDRIIDEVERQGVKMVVGHTQSYSPSVIKMRELIVSGQFGRLAMMSSTTYNDFLYRPRRPEELVTELGGGIIYNQVPHQVDTVRYLGGGLVRSVRALTWVLDQNRPTEGCYMALLDFENGAGASLMYSGYDHLSSAELFGQRERPPERVGSMRRSLGVRPPEEESAMRVARGYVGRPPLNREGSGSEEEAAGASGLVVTCEGADLRSTSREVLAYTTDGLQRFPPSPWRGDFARGNVIDELYYGLTQDRPIIHHGRWAKATLEVCLAALSSAHTHSDVKLSHQVPTVDL